MNITKTFTEWFWLKRMWFSNMFEQFREWLAFKIFPELTIYIEAIKLIGGIEENKKIVEVIEQSNLRNKKAVVELIKTKYYTLDDIKESLDDAFEDQTS